jgi:hypothetical protein
LIVPVYQRAQEPAAGLKEQAAEHL